jgi:hypothetical protein
MKIEFTPAAEAVKREELYRSAEALLHPNTNST